MISDPNPSQPNPLVSLNGDGLGISVLQSLGKKHPKVFKVPNHGSVHNSIPLTNEFKQDDVELTAQLITTQVLLEKAINGNIEILNAEFIDRLSQKFERKIGDVSKGTETRKRRRAAIQINFPNTLAEVAEDFMKNLHDVAKVNTSNLLAIL